MQKKSIIRKSKKMLKYNSIIWKKKSKKKNLKKKSKKKNIKNHKTLIRCSKKKYFGGMPPPPKKYAGIAIIDPKTKQELELSAEERYRKEAASKLQPFIPKRNTTRSFIPSSQGENPQLINNWKTNFLENSLKFFIDQDNLIKNIQVIPELNGYELHEQMLETQNLLLPQIPLQDFTFMDVFTIDPIGSTDADDAFSLYRDDEEIILVVHIANPTAGYNLNSGEMQNAAAKVTSRYPLYSDPNHLFPDYIVNKYTLQTRVDDQEIKTALSICYRIKVIENGFEINCYDITFSSIKVQKRFTLTYEQAGTLFSNSRLQQFEAGAIVNNVGSEADISNLLKNLFFITESLRNKRNGAEKEAFCDFSNGERIYVDNNTVCMKSLIEELAIVTNIQVAEFLNSDNEIEGIYRTCGIGEFDKAQAQRDLGAHEKLNAVMYTHATSPLRRFSDCLIHYLVRILIYKKMYPITYLRDKSKNHVFMNRDVTDILLKNINAVQSHFRKLGYSTDKYKLLEYISNSNGQNVRLKGYGSITIAENGTYLNFVVNKISVLGLDCSIKHVTFSYNLTGKGFNISKIEPNKKYIINVNPPQIIKVPTFDELGNNKQTDKYLEQKFLDEIMEQCLELKTAEASSAPEAANISNTSIIFSVDIKSREDDTELELIKQIITVYTPNLLDHSSLQGMKKKKKGLTKKMYEISILKGLMEFCIQNGYLIQSYKGTQFCRTTNGANIFPNKELTYMNCNFRGNWSIKGSKLTHATILRAKKDLLYINMTPICLMLGASIKEGGSVRGIFNACCRIQIVCLLIKYFNENGIKLDGIILFDSVDSIYESQFTGEHINFSGDWQTLPESYKGFCIQDVHEKKAVYCYDPKYEDFTYAYPEFLTVNPVENLEIVENIPIEDFYGNTEYFQQNGNNFILDNVFYGENAQETLQNRPTGLYGLQTFPYLGSVDHSLSQIESLIHQLTITHIEDLEKSYFRKEVDTIIDNEDQDLKRLTDIVVNDFIQLNSNPALNPREIQVNIRKLVTYLIDRYISQEFDNESDNEEEYRRTVYETDTLNREQQYLKEFVEYYLTNNIPNFIDLINSIPGFKVNFEKLLKGDKFLERQDLTENLTENFSTLKIRYAEEEV